MIAATGFNFIFDEALVSISQTIDRRLVRLPRPQWGGTSAGQFSGARAMPGKRQATPTNGVQLGPTGGLSCPRRPRSEAASDYGRQPNRIERP